MPGRILIVDDSPSDLLITGSILENLDHFVVKSQDGFSAVEKLSEEKFDLIIVDLQMPQMPGIELIKRIRRVPKYINIPILVASARSEVSDVKLAVQVGANDYLVKPMDPMICEEKVTRLLGSQSNWKEYEITNPELSVLGTIMMNFKILSMSEVSMTIETAHSLKQGEVIELSTQMFMGKGIDIFQGKIKSSIQVNGKYMTQIFFVATKESSRTQLRLLCREIWQSNKKEKFS